MAQHTKNQTHPTMGSMSSLFLSQNTPNFGVSDRAGDFPNGGRNATDPESTLPLADGVRAGDGAGCVPRPPPTTTPPAPSSPAASREAVPAQILRRQCRTEIRILRAHHLHKPHAFIRIDAPTRRPSTAPTHQTPHHCAAPTLSIEYALFFTTLPRPTRLGLWGVRLSISTRSMT